MILRLPPSYKTIGVKGGKDSLGDPAHEGYVFCVQDANGNYIGSAKSYLIIDGESTLRYDRMRFDGTKVTYKDKVVYLETNAAVYGYNGPIPKPQSTRIHIIKKRIVGFHLPFWNRPVLAVERDGKMQYANNVRIQGPCTIIYDPDNYHELGGKTRIETSANVVLT